MKSTDMQVNPGSAPATRSWSKTILGEACSKSNSPIMDSRKKRVLFIKSKASRAYDKEVKRQVTALDPMLQGDLVLVATLYYGSKRKDLDGEQLVDSLQGLIYANDKQLVSKYFIWELDRENPRAEVTVRETGTWRKVKRPRFG